MKIHIQTFLVFIVFLVALTSCKKEITANEPIQPKEITTTENATTIEMIQFHSEHRCVTCQKIENLTLRTLKSYPEISFKLINVDDEENEIIANEFEAFGTALFLYNPTTKEKLNLTEFAFMTVKDETKYESDLKKEIDVFGK